MAIKKQNKRAIDNKKAVSEVVAYVLLIVIALSIAGTVYGWLKFHIPKEKQTCPDSVAVVIKEHSCNTTSKEINLILQNKGLFSVNGFYIRISNKSGEMPVLEPAFLSSTKSVSISQYGYILFAQPLAPNEEFNSVFTYQQHNVIKEIEIEPFRIQEKETVLCTEATIKQNVQGC